MPYDDITEETYIRRLPYTIHHRIATHLDPYKRWMVFVQNIPKGLDFRNFKEKYSVVNIQQFEMEEQRPHGSPTKSILNDWGKENPKVRHLLKVFVAAELYAVADFISVDVLGRGPVDRYHPVGEMLHGINNIDVLHDELPDWLPLENEDLVPR